MKTEDLPNNIQQALLAQSVAKDYASATKEWVFQNRVIDHAPRRATCDLCGSNQLRYQFQIVNRETGELLWIGSQCVTQFGVNFYSRNGVSLSTEKAQKNAIKHTIKAEQIYHLMQPLHDLFEKLSPEKQRRMRWIIGKFDQRGGFAPDELDELFFALQHHSIAYTPQDYPITLRSKADKLALLNMPPSGLSQIWDSLSEKQQSWYNKQRS